MAQVICILAVAEGEASMLADTLHKAFFTPNYGTCGKGQCIGVQIVLLQADNCLRQSGCVYAGQTMRQPVSKKQDTVASFPMFGWSELRDALAKWLPPGCLQLSKRFTKLEQHEDHVVVHFADGSSIATRLLVGADGVFSKVRQQSLADGPPDFTVQAL